MRFIKPIVIGIFLIALIIFIVNWFSFKGSLDTNPPVIELGPKMISVNVDATDRELMQSVQARDSKDGDLTGALVIESISKFTDEKKHICNITYAVEDSDHNVAKATRKIRYKNYTTPKFVLRKPLKIDTGSEDSLRDLIGAVDCIDGDISRKVKILSAEFSTSSTGDSTVTAQVTNSKGDTITLKAHVIISDTNVNAPTIKLKENIVYLKKGSSFDEKSYIRLVESSTGTPISKSKVKVLNNTVKTNKKGCYYVEYIINEGKTNESVTILTVVVED